MTSAIRKQIERSRLASKGGKRVDIYLSGDEVQALQAYQAALGLDHLTDAVRALIRPHIPKPGEPVF